MGTRWRFHTSDKLASFYGPYIPTEGSSLPALARSSTHPMSPKVQRRLELELLDFRAHGALWDAYSIRFVDMHPDINLIAKFTDITSFPTHAHPSYNSYTSSDARRAVANEIHIFLGPLKILQGHIVPRFLGMVGSLQSDGG